ncbi:MAG TPA: hypothetical protein VG889_05715 [Rhizomicrobium sp.]|nr:hypothetical protein [Rhizomicrobium sp.]
MELAALSDTYGDFYAPAFSVRVRAKDLMRDMLLAISQVEVTLVQGAMSSFSFTVVDAFDFESRSFLTGSGDKVIDHLNFGAEVQICLGYGDSKSMPLMLSGVVSKIETSFPEAGSPELTIAGFDHAFPMSLGKNYRTWNNKTDTDVVREIASLRNLAVDVDETKTREPKTEQNQQSDLEFLKKLAEKNSFALYVDEHKVLHFHKPDKDSDPVVALRWGQGLLSFKPSANLAGQVTAVEVRAWDPKLKDKIVGTARAGSETDKGEGTSGGEKLGDFGQDSSKLPVLRVRLPVFNQAEADSRAKAMLDENAEKMLTGDAEAIGVPDIRVDCRVELKDLGTPFSRAYYIEEVTHKVDSSGYRTRFKVKERAL